MSQQTALWAGSFGNDYSQRNQIEYSQRLSFWTRIVDLTQCKSVFELGCNRGHNLMALRACGVPMVSGIDVNEQAVNEARDQSLIVGVADHNTIDKLTVRFDLTMSVGVLIHIAPAEVRKAMRSLIAVSNRYVLAIEYDSWHEEEVLYRGHKEALWRRPYGEMYSAMGLQFVDCGMLGQPDGFDPNGVMYWLMSKQ